MDRLLNGIKSGKSLDQVLREHTSYGGLRDFETGFAADGAAFVKNLMTETGSGRGALVNNNLGQIDLLPDTPSSNTSFLLNTDYIYVNNIYPDGYPVMAGGGSTQSGISGYGNTSGGGTTPGGTVPGGGNVSGGADSGTTSGVGAAYGRSKGSSFFGGLQLQIGSEAGEHMTIHIEAVNAAALGVDQVNISTMEKAEESIDIIGYALNRVANQRSALGAYQNRLEHTVLNLDNVIENTHASESRIRDTDMAEEMVAYSNLNIIKQAGISMLSGSDQNQEGVLALLM
ncbi:MAG: hypothetical protein IJC59_03650 [Lachnospiraceae bacterium]|nr:hypothetical protein [Lachnospiraceae bacterium]